MHSPERDPCNGKTVATRARAQRYFPQDLGVTRAGGEPRKPRRYLHLFLILYLLDVDNRSDTHMHVLSAPGFGAPRLPFAYAPSMNSGRTTASNGGGHDE